MGLTHQHSDPRLLVKAVEAKDICVSLELVSHSSRTIQVSDRHRGGVPLKYYVRSAALPLAVYREVEAHLRQVAGVEVGLVTQQSSEFDYTQSQVESLWVQYSETIAPTDQERVKQILAYYGDRYGAWQAVSELG